MLSSDPEKKEGVLERLRLVLAMEVVGLDAMLTSVGAVMGVMVDTVELGVLLRASSWLEKW